MANLILNVNKDMFRQLWPTLGNLIITKNGEKVTNLILNVNKVVILIIIIIIIIIELCSCCLFS